MTLLLLLIDDGGGGVITTPTFPFRTVPFFAVRVAPLSDREVATLFDFAARFFWEVFFATRAQNFAPTAVINVFCCC